MNQPPRPSLLKRLFTPYAPSGRLVVLVCAFVTLTVILIALDALP